MKIGRVVAGRRQGGRTVCPLFGFTLMGYFHYSGKVEPTTISVPELPAVTKAH